MQVWGVIEDSVKKDEAAAGGAAAAAAGAMRFRVGTGGVR